jgi:hypothetical protein
LASPRRSLFLFCAAVYLFTLTLRFDIAMAAPPSWIGMDRSKLSPDTNSISHRYT